METLRVNLGPRSYDIAITGGADRFTAFVRQAYPRLSGAFIVTDQNARPHASRITSALKADNIKTRVTMLNPGENTKCLEVAGRLYDDLAAASADRQTLVIAVGGGVIGDLAGFAAATYNRGLPLFMVPTTLLAMVDSSVGGKVGINHPRGKNLIGAFHQPVGVWIDIGVLETLPAREYRSGLAEVVKYGVIMDEPFFDWQVEHLDAILRRDGPVLGYLIGRCCRLKADVVEKDEREETGLRMILNYGHTFAHAFEAVGGYGAWLHGEAVAAGMIGESRLAQRHGLIDQDVIDRQAKLLRAFGLPVAPLREWPVDEMLDAMYRDKKTQAGKLRFVLPTRVGAVRIVDGFADAEITAELEAFRLETALSDSAEPSRDP